MNKNNNTKANLKRLVFFIQNTQATRFFHFFFMALLNVEFDLILELLNLNKLKKPRPFRLVVKSLLQYRWSELLKPYNKVWRNFPLAKITQIRHDIKVRHAHKFFDLLIRNAHTSLASSVQYARVWIILFYFKFILLIVNRGLHGT